MHLIILSSLSKKTHTHLFFFQVQNFIQIIIHCFLFLKKKRHTDRERRKNVLTFKKEFSFPKKRIYKYKKCLFKIEKRDKI